MESDMKTRREGRITYGFGQQLLHGTSYRFDAGSSRTCSVDGDEQLVVQNRRAEPSSKLYVRILVKNPRERTFVKNPRSLCQLLERHREVGALRNPCDFSHKSPTSLTRASMVLIVKSLGEISSSISSQVSGADTPAKALARAL